NPESQRYATEPLAAGNRRFHRRSVDGAAKRSQTAAAPFRQPRNCRGLACALAGPRVQRTAIRWPAAAAQAFAESLSDSLGLPSGTADRSCSAGSCSIRSTSHVGQFMVKALVQNVEVMETATLVTLGSAKDDHFHPDRAADLARTVFPWT